MLGEYRRIFIQYGKTAAAACRVDDRVEKAKMPHTDAYPLSQSQQNIWRLERTHSGAPIGNICEAVHIRGRFDPALLQESLNHVLAQDASLRTRLLLSKEGEPRQYTADYTPVHFPVFDFTLSSKESFDHWEATVAREPLPLVGGPLFSFSIFKLGESHGGVLLKTHHIISDGWSQVLLTNRVAAAYLALLAGEPLVEESYPSYRRHVDKEQAYATSAAHGRDQAFWENLLAEPFTPAAIKECKSAQVSPIGLRKTFDLPELLNHAIFSFCEQNRVSPFAVFYMALAIYLKRAKGLDRFSIGVPIFNRGDFVDRETTGMFVSTLPFLFSLDESWSFEEFNRNLGESWYDLLRHQRLPFAEIAAQARAQHPHMDQLFHLVLSYQNGVIMAGEDASVTLSGQWDYNGYQGEQLCIHLNNIRDIHRYSVSYDYLAQLFSEREITDLHSYLTGILYQALENPRIPIREIALPSREEQETVLFDFNRTNAPLPFHTLYEGLRLAYEKHPRRVAVIHDGHRYPYALLEQRANDYAHALSDSREPVAIGLPRTQELLMAMAGAAQAGRPWVLLSPSLPQERAEELIRDSGATTLLLSEDNASSFAHLELPILSPQSLPHVPEAFVCPAAPGDLAYLVYTSGSTGHPKGVEITQENLCSFASGMSSLYGHGAVLSLCNLGFDVFLLESMAALLNGRTIVLPREEDLERPQRLAELITGFAVGTMALTPSRLSAYLKNPAFQRAVVRVESLICGGESISPALLHQIQLLTDARIYNQYGPSEATVGVSYKLLNGTNAITAGRPMDNCKLYVLDQYRHPLPIGVYGEIYIGGKNVGRGYRNASELTEKSFFPSPFSHGERLYRTGDVGCWTKDGELLLGGRMDSQLKVRGVRLEPQEITACLLGHPRITDAALRMAELSGVPCLVAYYTTSAPLTKGELLRHMGRSLPDYMIPAHLVEVPEIPLSPNGKADVSLLPLPQASPEDASATPLERQILDLFQRVLNRPGLTPNSDYFSVGGDSLNAMETLLELESIHGLTLTVSDLYALRTARNLAALLADETAALPKATGVPAAPDLEDYPLTPAQAGIFLQSQLDPAGLVYHMPGHLVLPTGLDLQRLESAMIRLIQEEPILRTGFYLRDGQPRQRVSPHVEFHLDSLSAATLEEAQKAFLAPFDLASPPLFRAATWKKESGETLLLLDLHHLIGDGLSTSLFLERLDRCYRGKSLHKPSLRYIDYAHYLAQERQIDLTYWEETLPKEPVELPTDLPRQRTFDYRGEQHRFQLDRWTAQACRDYCAQRGISLFTLLAGVFGILLSKISGADSLSLGTPMAGRNHSQLDQMLGCFVSTLPLTLTPNASAAARDYLADTGKRIMELLDRQDTPLERLLPLGKNPHSLGGNPLYSALFSLRPKSEESLALDGHPLNLIPIPTHTAKLELSLEAAPQADGIAFTLEYASSLFEEATIALYGRCYRTILGEILADDSRAIGALAVLSPSDRFRLWDQHNQTKIPFLKLPLDVQIDQAAKTHPHRVAIRFEEETLTYGELRTQTDALAARLQAAGAQRGAVIALCCRRTPQLLLSMIAIAKAGCAYLPVSRDLPPARVAYMLQNAGAVMILTDGTGEDALRESQLPRITIDCHCQTPFRPVEGRTEEDLLYVLYTSGSTGMPKGVMVPHRAICNLLLSIGELLAPTHGPVLCTTGITFDTFITESLLPLALGRTVILAGEEESLLPWRIASLMERYRPGLAQFTPSRLQMCLGEETFRRAMAGVESVILVGEALSDGLLRLLQSTGSVRILNMYGPTEAAVYVTVADLTRESRSTIGHGLANCRLYVLDETQAPVLPTAQGELYLAGDCLALGYCQRPDLTQAAFLTDPFFPGESMYRTGDMVRLRADGSLDFLGRLDGQVKIGGQRVELQEVETALLDTALISQTAVLGVEDGAGSKFLWAFLVPARESKLDLDALRARLAQRLPRHMVPQRMTILSCLPQTASGKTDRLALLARASETDPSPAPAAPGAKKPALEPHCDPAQHPPQEDGAGFHSLSRMEPPTKVTPSPEPLPPHELPSDLWTPPSVDALAALWQQVLHIQPQPNQSFFQQGGTSLGALSLLSLYYGNGWSMTLLDFYNHPTLVQQAALLNAPYQEGTAKEPIATFPAAQPVEEIKSEFLPQPARPTGPVAASSRDTLLLTGATGYLGAHLLKTLVEADRGPVLCPIRGGQERLYSILSWYFGQGWLDLHRSDLRAIPGDITQPRLGLGQSIKAGGLIHAAADVRHYAPPADSLRTNRDGTAHVLSLAWDLGVPLHHISTISVSGEYLTASPQEERTFTERDYDIGQNWRDNVYVQSKFLAEGLVHQAIERGLHASIYRVGHLVGRDSDGMFQRNPESNSLFSFLQGLRHLYRMPLSQRDTQVELTAVDLCARAISLLMQSDPGVYHVINPHTLSLYELSQELGLSIEPVPDQSFETHLAQVLRGEHGHALSMVLDLRLRSKAVPTRIHPTANSTQDALSALGFAWPEPSPARLLKAFFR